MMIFLDFDVVLHPDAVYNPHNRPLELNMKPLNVGGYVVACRIENYFEYQPLAIRHHALWDARTLAKAVKGIVDD